MNLDSSAMNFDSSAMNFDSSAMNFDSSAMNFDRCYKKNAVYPNRGSRCTASPVMFRKFT
jgi:hypothetical protein